MAKLFVGVNMFTSNQDIILVEGDLTKPIANVPMDRLGEVLASFVSANQADEIEIHGNKEYAEQILFDIKQFLKTTYSENVRITINGEVCN